MGGLSANEKCPAGAISGEAFSTVAKLLLSAIRYEHLPVPSSAFSAQFATEFTSDAAP